MKKQIDNKIRVKRVPKRGHYDQETIRAVLDRSFICHVGFVHDGYPVVIPTAFGRLDDSIYLHGAQASRMMKIGASGVQISVATTQVTGLVLAKSIFNHSMNYESVVLFGQATEVVDHEEKMKALEAISNHIIKDRWAESRLPNAKEMKATMVLKLPLQEATAKIRTGPPGDDKADLDLPIWSGVIPIDQTFGQPIPADYDQHLEQPPSVRALTMPSD